MKNRITKKIFSLLILSFIFSCNNAKGNESKDDNKITERENIKVQKNGEKEVKKVNIKINSRNFVLALYDNEATRELMKKFPLTIKMDDLHRNEKYFYLNNGLPTDSERVGNIKTGDFMLFGNDCLVLFYENFSTGYSYTRLGYIEDIKGLKEALGKGSASVVLE